METFLNIALIAILVVGLFFIYQKISILTAPKDTQNEKLLLEVIENMRRELNDNTHKSRLEMQQQLKTINDQIGKGMSDTAKSLHVQLKQSGELIHEVTEKLTKLDETNKKVVGFAEQMKSLEHILKNPKQRGILGEYFLETLLGNILPPTQYKMQYTFKNGEIVDAVIFFKDKIVPIDAKFSLEKYNKIMVENEESKRTILEKEFKLDIKNRIDETSKYIRASENTTDFAFMFIPAEGIYYNLLIYKQGTLEINTTDLIEYAFKKHVIMVSPTSFYAYLETVLQGLKALDMEASVKDVIKKVVELGRHLNSYEAYMVKMGKNLATTVNMYNQASHEYKKIDKDLVKISDKNVPIGSQIEHVEKPLLVE